MSSGVDFRHFYSAVRIVAKNKLPDGVPSVTYGTGFLVQVTSDSSNCVIVSNRHILNRAWSEPLWIDSELTLDLDIWLNRDRKLSCKIVAPEIFSHPDDTVDVAAVPFHHVLVSQPDLGDITVDSALPWEFLVQAESYWDCIEPSEAVFLPGYPEWYDRADGRPIMRTGSIVSDPQFDYRRNEGPPTNLDGNRQILFEAFSSSGNSGSPVFVAQRGMQSSTHIKYTGVYHPSLLVGINAGHTEMKGDAIQDADGKIHLTNWHVGLSRMFKTSAIADVVKAVAQGYDWT